MAAGEALTMTGPAVSSPPLCVSSLAHDAAARTVAARRSDLNGYFIDDQFLVLFPDAAYLCGTVVLAESVIAPVGVEVHEVGR